MAGMNGLALLGEIRRRRPDAVVVLMTAYATIPGAVEAMRAGAYDYLAKPFALDEVGLLLDRVLEVQRLRRENRALREASSAPVLLESANPAMRRVLEVAQQAARSNVTVLLTGESGTGKNVLASAIHGWSGRAAGPFVAIACTTLAEHLVESELFGHMKGAFTGAWKDKPGRLEAAAGGTVLLDEVGELGTRAARQAAALPRGASIRTARWRPLDFGRRPRRCRNQSRPRERGARRAVPRGPVLPAERARGATARAARAAGRPGGIDRSSARGGSRCAISDRGSRSVPKPAARLSHIAGRATSASW
jgi:CheY-like chemotaxis protein